MHEEELRQFWQLGMRAWQEMHWELLRAKAISQTSQEEELRQRRQEGMEEEQEVQESESRKNPLGKSQERQSEELQTRQPGVVDEHEGQAKAASR